MNENQIIEEAKVYIKSNKTLKEIAKDLLEIVAEANNKGLTVEEVVNKRGRR